MARIVSTGSALSSPEFYHKKLKARRKRFVVFLFLCLALFIGLVLVARIPKFRITKVVVEGAQAVSPDAVQNVTEEVLHRNYLWVIPKNNVLLYPSRTLKDVLAKTFPRFNAIDISLSELNTLTVTVGERKPFGLYCGSSATANSANCFFLDTTGFIFDHAPTFSGAVYFIFGREDAYKEPLGKQFVDGDEFEKFLAFITGLKRLGFSPESLFLKQGEVRIISEGGKQADVVWHRGDDPEKIFSNLESFMNSEAIKNQKGFLEHTKELDLRTQNKVYYTFRNEEHE